MSKIIGIRLDVEKCLIDVAEVDGFNGMKSLLGIDFAEHMSYRFGKSKNAPILDVWGDEEAYYNSGVVTMAEIENGHIKSECAYGNVFICKSNDDGEFESLSEADIKAVMGCARLYVRDGKRIPLFECEFPYWDEVAQLQEEFGDNVIDVRP